MNPAASPPTTRPSDPGDAAHQTLITTITNALTNGLIYPGNPETGHPAHAIHLPMFRTAGMPPQMAQAVQESTQHIAEAIITLIETTHTITPKANP